MKASAVSGTNIAFVKYWGHDRETKAPLTPSLSMTFADLVARTTVEDGAGADSVELDGRTAKGGAEKRVLAHLAMLKKAAKYEGGLTVVSRNNFPMGAGVASSAAGFSALTMAACDLMGFKATVPEMAALSAEASGSAARSFIGGFASWTGGGEVEQIADERHWDLVDLVLVISDEEKPVSSNQGHRIAWTSPLNDARVDRARGTHQIACEAVRARDFWALAEVSEEDALMMHAVIMTSTPSIVYWTGGTVEAIKTVRSMQREGVKAFFTIDAGPNVHVITTSSDAGEVKRGLEALPFVDRVLSSGPGMGTRPMKEHLF